MTGTQDNFAVDELLSEFGSAQLLQQLSVECLLPHNQAREERFSHIAKILLCKEEHQQGTGQNSDCAGAFQTLIRRHDQVFGAQFQLSETGYGPVPYLSWIKVDEVFYRIPTGTYHWSEIFLQSVVDKLLALHGALDEIIGASGTNLIEFFVPRIDSFIRDAGIAELDFANVRDSKPDKATEKKKILDSFQKHLSIKRQSLDGSIQLIFDKLSVSPGQLPQPSTAISAADLVAIPLVRLTDNYIILFPQQFLPALLNRISDLLDWKNSKPAQKEIADALLHKTFENLRSIFGVESVFPLASFQGRHLADILCIFDNKLFFVDLLIDTAQTAIGSASHAAAGSLGVWQQVVEQASTEISCYGGTLIVPDPKLLEPIFITVIDGIKKSQSLVLDRAALPEEIAHLVLCAHALQFILSDCGEPLEFLKFIRAIDRLTKRDVATPGTDILDLFAQFKQTGGFGPPGRFPNANIIFFEPHDFSEYFYEQICDFRKENALLFDGLNNQLFERPYPQVLRSRSSSGRIYWRIEHQTLTINVWANVPSEISNEPGAYFPVWSLVTDSLTYHLGKKASNIFQILTESTDDQKCINITLVEAAPPITVKVETQLTNDRINCTINFSRLLQQGFINNNQSERAVFNALFESLSTLLPNRDFSAILIPALNESRFRMIPVPIEHPSLLQPVKPTRIYKSDDWLVGEIEAKVLENNAVTEGLYEEKKILSILRHPLDALRKEIEKRVVGCNSSFLTEWCYVQLEVAYIYYHQRKASLAVNMKTAEFSDPASTYQESARESTELNFALRFILETAVRLNSKSDHIPSIEETSLLLAIARRLVDLDFMGDYVFLLGILRTEPLRLRITEWGYSQIEGVSDFLNLPSSQQMHEHVGYIESLVDPANPSGSDIRTRLETHFNSPFNEEFGYSLSARLLVQEALEVLFEDIAEPIMKVSTDSLVTKLRELTYLTDAEILKVASDLELRSDVIQSNQQLSPSQHYWRDGRLLNRPLLRLTDGNEFLFARSTVNWSFRIFVGRLLSCRFDASKIKTQALRSAVGSWAEQMGENFRVRVCNVLQENNWEIHSEVSSFNNKAIPMEGVGPIDIVAINSTAKRMWVVECKRSTFSRNPKDLKTEYEKYFGYKGEIGYVKRILNKAEWVRTNKNDVATQLRIWDIDCWEIDAVLVTSEYVWAVDVKRPQGLSTYTLDQLREAIQT